MVEITHDSGLTLQPPAWANRIGVKAKEVHIGPMKRKWANYSTTGRFSFNEELLKEPPRFRKEVILHELLHLKVPNHRRLFKALLKLKTYLVS